MAVSSPQLSPLSPREAYSVHAPPTSAHLLIRERRSPPPPAGVGVSSGKNRAEEAALAATSAPLIEVRAPPLLPRAPCRGKRTAPPPGSRTNRVSRPPPHPPHPLLPSLLPLSPQHSIERATGVVYNITGGKDLTLQEVNTVSQVVTGLADPSANVIFGAVRGTSRAVTTPQVTRHRHRARRYAAPHPDGEQQPAIRVRQQPAPPRAKQKAQAPFAGHPDHSTVLLQCPSGD